MATTTFTAASLIFVTIWLEAVVSFSVVASSLFLYILGSVDASIGPSLAISLSCAILSFLYLILQCVNVSQTKRGHWHRSWLSSSCVQLPRALIVLWMIATIVGFVAAVRKPLCQNSGIGQNAAEWQAGVGCWVFRVLVFLDAIMLVLCFVLFCLLEVNGRYVSLALFHFEYTRSSNSSPYPRRNLIASPYGASVETLTCPTTMIPADGHECTHEKQGSRSKRSLSPSPTYHTFDSARTNSTFWHGSGKSTGGITRSGSQDDLLDEYPIPMDLTLYGSLPARRSAPLTAAIPVSNGENTSTNTIYSGAQLQSRPISNVPTPPSATRSTPQDVKDHTTSIVTAPMAAKAILDDGTMIRPAPHNVTVNMVDPVSRFKSTSALPFEYATRSHSMIDLSCCSTTHLISNTTTPGVTARPKYHAHSVSVDTTHRLSTSCLPECPAPAWCPQNLRSVPLSADPAIRRLTEFQSRSRSSMARASRISTMSRRRGSLGAFEFGFNDGNKTTIKSQAATPQNKDSGKDTSIDLSALPPTPTPTARKRTTNIDGKQAERHGTDDKSKHNRKSSSSTTITTTTPKKNPIMNRPRARAGTTSSISSSTTSKAQFSIMPPLTTPRDPRRPSISGLGLTFDGSDAHVNGKDPETRGSQKKRVKHGRSGSVAVESAKGKKIVERGRYEKLPR